MAHDRQHTSRRTDRRGHTVGVVLAVTVLALVAAVLAVTMLAPVTAAVATPAGAQGDGPTVRVVGEAVGTDRTATVRVVLTTAPEGLSGYALELSVENPDVARVEGASYPERFGLTTEAAPGAGGRTVTLEAVDLDSTVEPGASNVTLATVEIAGEAAGETAVSVDGVRLDDDSGDPLDPAVQSGTVAVTDETEGSQATDGSGEGGQATGEPTPTTSGQRADEEMDGDGESGEDGTTDDDTSGASGDLPLYVPVVAIGVVALAAVLLGRRP